MMNFMRNAAKTWAAKLLLGLLVVAFGAWGVSGVSGSAFEFALQLTGFGAKDLAIVGNSKVNFDDYNRNLENQRKQIAKQSGQSITLDDAHKLGLDKQVLDSMIASAALANTQKNLNLSVGDNVIRQEAYGDKNFQGADGKFSPVQFQQVLAQNNVTEAGYFANQKEMHARAAMLNIASGELALPKTFNQALTQFQGETRDVKYFNVTATEADVAKPTDQDLAAQYKKTPAAYTAPEYRTVALMKVEPADLAARLSLTPEELQAGYVKYKADYFTPETRTIIQVPFASLDDAKKAKARIVAGEDILKIATEMKLKDTDITLVDKVQANFLDAKIGEAAFALTEGKVSEPIAGGLATVLLKALKVAASKQATLDEVKDALTKRLQLEKAKEEIQSIYNAVEDARAQNLKFEEIAGKVGIPLTMLPGISAIGQNKDGKDIEFPAKPEILKALFNSDVGIENDALSITEGYYWYDVRSVVPSALKPLDAVKDQVTKDIVASRIHDAAGDKAKKLIALLNGGKTMEAVAVENATAVKTATALKRNQQADDFDGPALEALFSVKDQGFASSVEGDGKTARVMQVTKINVPAVMATSPEIEQAKTQAKSGFGSDLQLAFVAALKKSVGVQINEALWKQNTGGDAAAAQ
jgi:peptidyl-prolyl cis-trans isomerase D